MIWVESGIEDEGYLSCFLYLLFLLFLVSHNYMAIANDEVNEASRLI